MASPRLMTFTEGLFIKTNMKKAIVAAAILACIYSCKRSDPPLEEALRFAGSNRADLEKVLEHYSKPSDSLKWKAARFLITNMPYQYGYYGREINTYSAIFSVIDTLSYLRESLTNQDKIHICDSFVTRYGWPKPENAERIYDSKIISPAYLISDIDFAFDAWRHAPWGKQVPFGDFCEYILPYRIRKERAEYWRPWFYLQYEKMVAGCPNPKDARSVFDQMNWNLNTATSFNLLINNYYPFNQSIGDVVKGKIGSCEMTAFFATSAMRAVGLPVGYDYIMHWGSSNNRHCLPHLVGHFGQAHLITNENVQQDTWHLVDFSSEFNTNRHRFTPDEVPKGLYIENIRTIPKVYRYTFSQSAELSDINKDVPADFISPEFNQTNLKDVTNEYVTTSDVALKLDTGFNKYKVAYLCVFDPSGWQPVAITKISAGAVRFKMVGKEVLYLPTVFHDGIHQPVAPPFYIDSLNRIHQIKINTAGKTDMRLLRKFPLYTYSAYHSEILKGGRFEGSNDSTFRNPATLYAIKGYPFFVNEVPAGGSGEYRYFRYVAPPDANFEPDNIAEVQFLDKDRHPLKGRFIGVAGIPGNDISKDRKSTRLNSSHYSRSRMPSSA